MFKNNKTFEEGLTYDDVLLVPRKSFIDHRSEIDTSTYLTANIKLQIPLISANMDSVTESSMAIALAQEGGLGIIHRFMPIEREAQEVEHVKRSEGFVTSNPYTITKETTLKEIWQETERTGVHSFVVVDKENRVLGLVTQQQTMFENNPTKKAAEIMTPFDKLVTEKPGISFKQAKEIFQKNRITKLPIIDKNRKLKGLITARSVANYEKYPFSTKDKYGRYMVGASVGVIGDYMERTEKIIEAGCDVIVVDVAHGHNDVALRAIKNIRHHFKDIDIIGGNIATAEGTTDTIKAGANAVKIGIGPGGLCTTRIIAGVGIPQLTAVMESARVASKKNIPIIADGGTNYPGDITKALAAGASVSMLAGWFAGTDESPGAIIMRKGMKYKIHRGSASFMATADRKLSLEKESANKLNTIVAEGVESIIPYKGRVSDVIYQLTGALRSGMSYCNAKNIPALWKNAKFIKITSAGFRESKSHNVEEI